MTLLQDRAELLAQARRDFLEPAVREKRAQTAEESSGYAACMVRVAGLDSQLAEMGGAAPASADILAAIHGAGGLPAAPRSAGPERWVDRDGRDIQVFGPGDSLAAAYGGGGGELSFGRFVKAAATGSWRGAEAERDAMRMSASLGEGAGATGGYVVPTPLSAQVLDLIRSKMVLNKAGCRTVAMESKTLEIASLTADPAAVWRAENAAITEGDPSFGGLQLSAKVVACLIKAPLELVEDAANLSAIVENAVGQAIAHEIDRVGLMGSGVGSQPTGITNWPSIPTVMLGTGAGASPSYSVFSESYQALQLVNAPDQVQLVTSPRTLGSLERLVDTLGQPINPPESWAKIVKLSTSAIPINETVGASNDCSTAIVGDFSQLFMGARLGLNLEVSREAGDASGSAFASLQLWIRAYARVDFAVVRPTFFQVISGIKP